MRVDIRIKYTTDSREYRLFSINKVDHTLDYFKFLPVPGYPSLNGPGIHFMKHQNIRDALLQATSYRQTQEGWLASQRADVEYLSVDGYKVNSFIFMQFI